MTEMPKNYDSYFDEDNNDIEMKPMNKQPSPKNLKKKDEFQIPLSKRKKSEEEEINIVAGNIDNEQGHEQTYVVDIEDLKKYFGEDFNEKMLLDIQGENEPLDLEDLENQFKEDPFNYDTLYKLISVYREKGMKDQLREIREYTIRYFPFSDEMWKEWIKDELAEIRNSANNSFDERYKLIEKFKQAFSDFYCKYFLTLDIKVCRKFLKFIIELHNELDNQTNAEKDLYSEITLESIRKYFEEFITFWGLDLNQSAKLYDLYINFEKHNLEKFKHNNDEIGVQNTTYLIRSIYRRRLSFPHVDLDLIWSEYKKWETIEDELEKVKIKYEDSSNNVSNFLTLEENFDAHVNDARTNDNISKLVLFLKKELPRISKKHFNYTVLYMEKALEVLCDYHELWELYIEFINANNKDKMKLAVLKRATRCSYSVITFWIMLFKEMERQGTPLNEIESNFILIFSTSSSIF
jgi:hypothetical protein